MKFVKESLVLLILGMPIYASTLDKEEQNLIDEAMEELYKFLDNEVY